MNVRKKGVKYPWACPQVWQRLSVLWDGTILPCNHDDDQKLAFGNVKEKSIYNVWNGKKLKQVRELHKNGDAHLINACDGCYLRDSEIAKLNDCEKK